MPPSQFRRPPPGPPVERRAGTRSGAAPRQPRHHSPGSRASGVPARRLLVLLVAVLAQGPVARWTPELAFAVKRVGSVAISPDGRWAAVEVSEPLMEAEPSEWRTSVYLYAVGGAGQQAARWVETPASAPAWSPDGRWLAFASSRSGKRDVWRVALDGSGGAERLTDVTGEGELGEFRWSPDGRRMAFVLTDPPVPVRDARVVGEGQRFARLYLVDVAGDAAGRVARLLTPQDVQVGGHVGAGMSGPAFDWSPDGAAIAFSHSPSPAGDDWVRADVSVVDVATGRTRSLVATPAAEGGAAWSPDGRWVAVTVSDAPATYALTFRVVLVSPVNGAVHPLAESFDRRPAIVGWTGDARAVVISEVRGTVSRLSAVPASAGFAVLRPNVRGSSGYGREFRYANLRDWGGGDFRDAMAGIDALVQRGVADSDRLGVMGWSYGGYLTAFAITQTTRFRAASVGAGITNLVSYVGVADIPGFIGSYFGGEFWDAPKLWQDRSAVFRVKAVTTPTLIQHGENDLRVPISQGYELYTALKRRHVPVTMVVYPRQGHGVGEPRLQLDVMRRNLEWFERWVMADRR